MSHSFCRTKDTVVREDNVLTDSFDEPVSEDRREKLHDMAFENYAFSEEDAELEMITKQPLSARSGREISPEDLRESFSEFDFDEREMKELKADFQQTGQQGVYQAKCSQHALSHRMPRDEGHGIDQPLNEADEDEMLGRNISSYLQSFMNRRNVLFLLYKCRRNRVYRRLRETDSGFGSAKLKI
jgi:hypothetical protein